MQKKGIQLNLRNDEAVRALVMRAQNGDKAALDLLANEYDAVIGSLIITRFGSAHYFHFDDLKQMGFIGLMKAIKRFDPKFGKPFFVYFYVCVIGEIRRYIRDHGSSTVHVPRQIKEAMMRGDIEWPEYANVDSIELVDEDENILDVVFIATLEPELTKKELVLIKLYYYEGYSQRQIAEFFGVTQMTVSRWLRAAVSKMRESAYEQKAS